MMRRSLFKLIVGFSGILVTIYMLLNKPRNLLNHVDHTLLFSRIQSESQARHVAATVFGKEIIITDLRFIDHSDEHNNQFLTIYGTLTLKKSNFRFFIELKRQLNEYGLEFSAQQELEMNMINLLVLLPMNSSQISGLLKNFEDLDVQKFIQRIYLIISTYGKRKGEIADFKKKVTSLALSFVNKIVWIEFNEKFRRGNFLHSTLMLVKNSLDVYLFIDIDFWIDNDFLYRCLHFGSFHRSGYFPVIYSKYNPKFTGCHFFDNSQRCGAWRYTGYGAVCTRFSNYAMSGGFNLKFTEWGKEDVDLFKRYKKKGLHVFRIADPGVHHLWHDKECSREDLSEMNYIDCLLSVSRYEGSLVELGLAQYCERHGCDAKNILMNHDLWKVNKHTFKKHSIKPNHNI